MIRSHIPKMLPALVSAAFISVFLAVPNASAQEFGRIQVYGGYSLLHPNLPQLDSDPATAKSIESLLGNLSGWNGGMTVGVTQIFSVAADFSGYYKNFNTRVEGSDFDANLRAYTFLFGPQFQKNGEQLRPFVRTLFGVAHGSAKATVDGESGKVSKSVFAASVGGGLDVKVGDRVSIRAGQLDYFPFRSSEGGGLTFNNFRFVTGVAFYLR